MVDAFIDTLEIFPRGLVYVGIGIVVLGIGKVVQDLLTPYKINNQLRTKDNVALALSITGSVGPERPFRSPARLCGRAVRLQ